jgi:hypothetical protein
LESGAGADIGLKDYMKIAVSNQQKPQRRKPDHFSSLLHGIKACSTALNAEISER